MARFKRPEEMDLSEGFDPKMLIALASVEAPEYPWLPDALANCGAGVWRSRAYVHYVSAVNANEPGAEWQFETNVVLEHDVLGTVILDILKGSRLGGIEFVSRLN